MNKDFSLSKILVYVESYYERKNSRGPTLKMLMKGKLA